MNTSLWGLFSISKEKSDWTTTAANIGPRNLFAPFEGAQEHLLTFGQVQRKLKQFSVLLCYFLLSTSLTRIYFLVHSSGWRVSTKQWATPLLPNSAMISFAVKPITWPSKAGKGPWAFSSVLIEITCGMGDCKVYASHKLCTWPCSVLHSPCMSSLCSSVFMLTFSSSAFCETMSLLPHCGPLFTSTQIYRSSDKTCGELPHSNEAASPGISELWNLTGVWKEHVTLCSLTRPSFLRETKSIFSDTINILTYKFVTQSQDDS